VTDPFELRRFVDVQQRVYDEVLSKLRAGKGAATGSGSSFRSSQGEVERDGRERHAISGPDEARDDPEARTSRAADDDQQI
jgi:uncharacterized protein (DUF1810 family)